MRVLEAQRERNFALLLFQLQSLLNRLEFLKVSVGSPEIMDRANSLLGDIEARGSEICSHDGDLHGINNLETYFVLQQAHDAYLLGLLDAVPVLCGTALEEELTIRYLAAHSLVQQVANGNRFETLVDGNTKATLEPLIQWAVRTTPPILTTTTEPLAREVQRARNDFAHAYAMRRVSRPMMGAGNVFTNNTALDIYKKTLAIINQMP